MSKNMKRREGEGEGGKNKTRNNVNGEERGHNGEKWWGRKILN